MAERSAPTLVEPARVARNHLVDLARIASMVFVVAYHSLRYRVELTHGRVEVVPWQPGGDWYGPVSWIAMILPLFFIVAGYAHAVALGSAPERAGLPAILGHAGRILPPVVTLVTVLAVLATVIAWLPAAPPWLSTPGSPARDTVEVARALSRGYCTILWFVAVHLVWMVLAPVAVRAQRRHPLRWLVAFLLVAAFVDAVAAAANDLTIRNVNYLVVYGFAHQLGIAYEIGAFRSGPAWRAWATLGLGAGGIYALLVVGLYPPLGVAFWDASTANSTPPTLLLALLALAQASVLGLAERVGLARRLQPWLERGVAAVTAVLVSVYLWHLFAIVAALWLLSRLVVMVPALAALALAPLTVVLVVGVVVGLTVPILARVDAWSAAAAATHGRRVAPAYALVFVGLMLVWQQGTVIHPRTPWSSLGVLLMWAGALALVGRRLVPPDGESPTTR